MAYNLSTSPSNSLSRETHLFCTSISPPIHLKTPPRNLKFPHKLNSPKPFLHAAQVSLQEQELSIISRDSEIPDEKSNSQIWVNPNSPRASKLRRKSHQFRYVSSVQIANSLNSCEPVEDDVLSVLNTLGDDVSEHEAVIVLDNISNAETACIALKYFRDKLRIGRGVVLYNVTLKSFRKSKDLKGAENLFNQMLEKGIKPDNVTFSTIISCARLSNLPNKAIEWFEKMPSFECEPDKVTCSVMIDAYGRVGNIDVALNLYERARIEKWKLDASTFSTLIKIYSSSGNFDRCLKFYDQMKRLGIRPNASVFNTLLDAMGRAKRPWQAKNIYHEMAKNGVEPTWGTYAALIRAYGRARYGEDAVAVYKQMKEKGFEVTVLLYNTLLSTCANVGFSDEGLVIFEDMKGKCEPDSWTFTSLIEIYCSSGRVEEAKGALNEMLEAGFEVNIFVLTSLCRCYGKLGRVDDVVATFDWLLELNIKPDDRFCGCLLNVMALAPKEEMGKLIICIEKANLNLGRFFKPLVLGEKIEPEVFKNEANELFKSIDANVKKSYCNCLIDLCVNLNQFERARELLELGLEVEIYDDVISKSETQWCLNLKGLSVGGGLTALGVWMDKLLRVIENGEEFPGFLGVNTGHGKRGISENGLACVIELRLKELNAPFHETSDKVGWFLLTKDAAMEWLESSRAQQVGFA